MNEKIQKILQQINTLEDEIEAELNEQKKRWLYQVHGKRVEFERSISEMHRSIKMDLFRWFMTVRPQNYLTAPIIYSMIFPMLLLDLSMLLYQLTCFPIYRIARVRRSDYISFDHRHLAYLNIVEKIDCLYCSYGNGLMAYVTEIFARTEQYFCPIKHAQKVRGMHARYQYFIDYGDAEDLHKKLEDIRFALIKEYGNSMDA
jgi:hypothetical protein